MYLLRVVWLLQNYVLGRNTGDAETGTESVSPHEMADWLMDCVLWTTAEDTICGYNSSRIDTHANHGHRSSFSQFSSRSRV